MISKKQVAAILAAVLTAVVVTLRNCDDETPLVPSVPVVGAVDAGQ